VAVAVVVVVDGLGRAEVVAVEAGTEVVTAAGDVVAVVGGRGVVAVVAVVDAMAPGRGRFRR
jgi:hypothetical protein